MSFVQSPIRPQNLPNFPKIPQEKNGKPRSSTLKKKVKKQKTVKGKKHNFTTDGLLDRQMDGRTEGPIHRDPINTTQVTPSSLKELATSGRIQRILYTPTNLAEIPCRDPY